MEKGCSVGVANEQRIIALERDMNDVKRAIGDLRDDLVKRPSWVVTTIITLLSSVAVGCLTFALTVIKMTHGA